MPKTDYGSLKPTTESDTRIFKEETKEAVQSKESQKPPSNSWAVVKRDPIVNTVYAESRQKIRSVKVNPSEIEKSLENIKRNKELERKGLS
jgi:hypothetical protein